MSNSYNVNTEMQIVFKIQWSNAHNHQNVHLWVGN